MEIKNEVVNQRNIFVIIFFKINDFYLTRRFYRDEDVNIKVLSRSLKLCSRSYFCVCMRVFCCIIWNVTMCLFVLPTGLRKVYPYYFTFTTFTKGRWVGEKILDVFAREFRAHPAEEYVSILLNRMLLLLPLNESSGAHKLVRFRQWKIDFHSALWHLTRPTLYWFSTETFVCIQHPTELFILGYSKT